MQFFSKPPKFEKNQGYFLCLGAGPNQMPLIDAIKESGIKTIAVDNNSRAGGFEKADISIHCSITRPGRIISLLKENILLDPVIGVATRSFGRATMSAALLAHRLGLPGINPSNLRIFNNKRLLMNWLKQKNIPHPESYPTKTPQDLKKLLHTPLPLLGRPIRSHAKIGIQFIDSAAALQHFLQLQRENNGNFLIEKFIKGNEITVLGLIENGKYRNISISDKIVSHKPPFFAEILHRYPSMISITVEKKINRIMKNIVNAARLTTGSIIAEFLINDEGEPFLIECAPETGGEFIAECIARDGAGINYFQEWIRIMTNSKIPMEHHGSEKSSKNAVIIRFIMPENGILKNIAFPEKLTNHPGFIFSRKLKSPGELISSERGNLDRIAVFALKAPLNELEILEEQTNEIVEEITVEYERNNRDLESPLSIEKSATLVP